jgi:hypothetical protein
MGSSIERLGSKAEVVCVEVCGKSRNLAALAEFTSELGKLSYCNRENPRLCREGSQSLTVLGVCLLLFLCA